MLHSSFDHFSPLIYTITLPWFAEQSAFHSDSQLNNDFVQRLLLTNAELQGWWLSFESWLKYLVQMYASSPSSSARPASAFSIDKPYSHMGSDRYLGLVPSIWSLSLWLCPCFWCWFQSCHKSSYDGWMIIIHYLIVRWCCNNSSQRMVWLACNYFFFFFASTFPP